MEYGEANSNQENGKEVIMENEILMAEEVESTATEQVAKTVEQSTETPKTYTQEEVDAIVGRKIARTKAKMERETARKYGKLEEVLKSGTGVQDVGQIADMFAEHYESKGVHITPKPAYNDADTAILAKADADEIICAGYEDVVEEVDRLAKIGIENMTARERTAFQMLAAHRQKAEKGAALARIGVAEEEYNSPEFAEFAGQFVSGTPIEDVYALYERTREKKEYKTMGSMKNSNSGDGGVKDFYTRDEALKFSRKDLDNNPALFAAIEKSMLKW